MTNISRTGTRRGLAAILVGAAMLAGAGNTANAQDFPAPPIKVVVPHGAGGGTDRTRPLSLIRQAD